jgi:hypothetical protein
MIWHPILISDVNEIKENIQKNAEASKDNIRKEADVPIDSAGKETMDISTGYLQRSEAD